LEGVGSAQFPVFFAGLELKYPIGNDAAENVYIKSKLLVEQSKTQVKSLEESISKDVRTAVRAVYSNYKQLDVTARGRAYAEQVVQAYIKKQKVGLATTKDVLDVLNNQVTAEGNQIQAVTDYNNAITNLWATTGELLEKEGIRITAKEADDLYGKNR
jgi:outer membrane protein TolC